MQQAASDDQDIGTIDWIDLHRRIETMRMALERGSTPSHEEERAVLKARAKALSWEAGQAAQEYLEVVEFRLAHEHYAIESSYIREVFPLRGHVPLPCTPAFVFGILNVRGQILSVLDIKKFFDLPETVLTDRTKVLIIHNDKMGFGLLADAIIGVRSIPLADIQLPPPTLSGIGAAYLRGLTSERLVVLAIDKMLAAPTIIVHEDVEP